MAKQSIKGAVRAAQREDTKVRNALVKLPPDGTQSKVATVDSFVNLAQGLGVSADSPLATASYGFNPTTRNRVLLEWIHRGSWIGGMAVDVMADDMTRAGVEPISDVKPDHDQMLDYEAVRLKVWDCINSTIKWGRLYGGALCVALIDGQDLRTPLRLDTVGPGQFKGLLTLDRWMVEPSLEDLVTEYGPSLGLPRYYRVQPGAPALRGCSIHYSRVMVRHVGVELPYQQQLTENLWGISVLERLYDRMVAFDSASTGAAQLTYKVSLRTLKIKGLRDIVAAGNKPLLGVYAYVDMMRRFQGNEGITMVDGDDEFEVQQQSSLFSGLSDVLLQLGQQLSGALGIPLTRLFGQSPAGLSATGESDIRTYYDNVNQRQQKDLLTGVTGIYHLMARSLGIQLPPNFMVEFSPLWQLNDTEKADVANKVADAVTKAKDGGMLSDQVAMKELKTSSRVTGIFGNISDEDINKASSDIEPPLGESLLDDAMGLGLDLGPGAGNPNQEGAQNGPPTDASGARNGPPSRKQLREEADAGGPPSGQPGEGGGQQRPAIPRRRFED